jgi:hypothetical protein
MRHISVRTSPAALAAVIEFGSFDAAAEQLHATTSAVSHRIKALRRSGRCHMTVAAMLADPWVQDARSLGR